jgi:glycosyltransferase involved in cell wall biosynthesis
MISVIIPARQAALTLPACLKSLQACAEPGSDSPPYECIVVDDASGDDTAATALQYGARLITLQTRCGPAAARNRGAAAARGDVLFFVDADVQVRQGTLARIARQLGGSESPDAVIGSYDDTPASRSFFSLYRNLLHHYVHQTSRQTAQTFWAGCGAIRRSAFAAVGGFSEAYHQPSVEDIELGYRLREAGYRITLDKQLQVTHLKRWTFRSMISTDIRHRAIPWSRLLLARRALHADLNLRYVHRLSIVLLLTALALIAGIPASRWLDAFELTGAAWAVPLSLVAITVSINAPLYWFFARKVGPGFALLSIPVHCTYYVYCGVSFLWVALTCVPRLARRGPTTESGEETAKRIRGWTID